MKKIVLVVTVSVVLLVGAVVGSTYGRILPNVFIGSINVGGNTPTQAQQTIDERLQVYRKEGIVFIVDGERDALLLEDIEAVIDVRASVSRALTVGRLGNPLQRLADGARSIVGAHHINSAMQLSDTLLRGEIDTALLRYEKKKKDIRFVVEGDGLAVAWDTATGKTIDRAEFEQRIRSSVGLLSVAPVIMSTVSDPPIIDPQSVPGALDRARMMASSSITLKTEDRSIHIDSPTIVRWITSQTEDQALRAGVDRVVLGQWVATMAQSINVVAQEPKLVLEGNRVKEFIAPRSGVTLNQEKAINDIVRVLEDRRDQGLARESEIMLDLAVAKPLGGDEIMGVRGIRERIGIATTTFTGSPPNRIANIKNGVKFLSGILIEPGAEFSTIQALGKIDNTTGYLPELVIKENRTIPEYGGGLCQVSTTLFRAVMNAGLPITQRQNHSYRVPYYERDGEGRTIGPGLDATIYSPSPDFRFKNDTGNTMLLSGYVHGDKVTFEFYGTNDGRRSSIEGPQLLSTTSAGEPILIETDTLPKGERKQIEKAHAGGSTVATYTITYPDGSVNEQVFKSVYRRWPAQFLVGTKEAVAPPPTPPEEALLVN